MSRAFIRDEDIGKPEPLPELEISPHPNLVTKRGLTLIEARLEAIERELREKPEEGRAELLQRDLRYWRQRRSSAEVTEPPPPGADGIGFGSRVTISRDGGPEEVLEIVGEDEADPAAGRISWMSPLGVALRGAEIGEVLEIGYRNPPLKVEIAAVDNGPAD